MLIFTFVGRLRPPEVTQWFLSLADLTQEFFELVFVFYLYLCTGTCEMFQQTGGGTVMVPLVSRFDIRVFIQVFVLVCYL